METLTGLPFEDALALLKQGYKIRQSNWPEHEHWFLDSFEGFTQIKKSFVSKQGNVEKYAVYPVYAEVLLEYNWEVQQ